MKGEKVLGRRANSLSRGEKTRPTGRADRIRPIELHRLIPLHGDLPSLLAAWHHRRAACRTDRLLLLGSRCYHLLEHPSPNPGDLLLDGLLNLGKGGMRMGSPPLLYRRSE